ncbi:unnamed protein product, partial [Iphiclides podalirius]
MVIYLTADGSWVFELGPVAWVVLPLAAALGPLTQFTNGNLEQTRAIRALFVMPPKRASVTISGDWSRRGSDAHGRASHSHLRLPYTVNSVGFN